MKSRFQQLLRAKIDKAMSDRAAVLLAGLAKDYAGYKHDIGFLQGLGESIKLMEEVESDISKGD